MNSILTAEEEAELHAQMREGKRERAFWAQHRREFLERYPRKVVAVKDGTVVATADTPAEILDALDALGLNALECWIEYFDPNPIRRV